MSSVVERLMKIPEFIRVMHLPKGSLFIPERGSNSIIKENIDMVIKISASVISALELKESIGCINMLLKTEKPVNEKISPKAIFLSRYRLKTA